jgi:hypothetical protein
MTQHTETVINPNKTHQVCAQIGSMARTQLCLVKRAASLVERILRLVPNHSSVTTINTVHLHGATLSLTGEFLRDRLRATCFTYYGGKAEFGFDAHKIGTKCIHLGAAMSLFFMNHSSGRIMLLGRWLSKAFRPGIYPSPSPGMDRQHVLRHDTTELLSGCQKL